MGLLSTGKQGPSRTPVSIQFSRAGKGIGSQVPHGKHVLEQGSQIVTCGNQAQALNPWQWERLGEMKAKGTRGRKSRLPHLFRAGLWAGCRSPA